MRLRIAPFSLVLALTLAPATALAGIEQAGTTAANFLSVGSSPATLAMGGAGLARTGELGLTTWNAATLAWIGETRYTFSHASLTEQSSQEWAAAAGRMGQGPWRWAMTGLYQGDGSFDGRDALGNPTGSFNVSSMAIGGTVARSFNGLSGVGVGFKYVSENLGGVTGSGIAMDAGFTYAAGPVSLGAAAQNAFGNMSYSGAKYSMPSNYGAGVALNVPASGVTLALDANFPKAYYNDVRFGAEWRYREAIALRGGYRMELGAGDGEPLSGPTFGLGAGANGFWFDYGFIVGGGGASGQHRLGLTFRPGVLNPGATSVAAPGSGYSTGSSKPRLADSESPRVEKSPKPAKPAKPAKVVAPKPEPVASAEPVKPAKPAKAEKRAVSVGDDSPVLTDTPQAVKIEPTKPAEPASDTEAAVVSSPKTKAPKAEKVKTPKPEKVKVEKPKKTKTQPDAPLAPLTVIAPEGGAVAMAAPSEPAEAAAPKAAEPVRVEAPKPAKTEAPAPVVAKPASRPDKVKVGADESLSDIAKRWDTSVAAIMMENNLVSDRVKPGQTLKLPPPSKK